MEYYILVIILVILAAVSFAVLYNWRKLFCQSFTPQNNPIKHENIAQNNLVVVQSPIVNEKEDISISFIQNDQNESSLALLVKKYNLVDKDYNIMKIRFNQVSYYKLDQGQKLKTNSYQTKYDDSFNEQYLHYEKFKDNQLVVYQLKSNQRQYQGNYDEKKLIFQKNKYENLNGTRKYNQYFPCNHVDYDLQTTIDAFALYLNIEEEKIFLSNQSKRNWFIPNITLQNSQFLKDITQQLEDQFWQFQPISYEIEMFCQKIFFVVNDLDQKSKYLVEINFSDQIIIHDFVPKIQEYYQHILQNLSKFFKNLKSLTVCLICKQQEESKSQGLDMCLMMMKYSTLPDKENIITPDLMKQYLQNQMFLDLI